MEPTERQTEQPRDLVLTEDIAAARDEVSRLIGAGDHAAAGRALARYTPAAQALVIRATFFDELKRADDDSPASIRLAARRAERVLDVVTGESARQAVESLDAGVLGAMVGAAAGDAASSVAHLVEPKRIERLLATDIELWTIRNPASIERDPDRDRQSGLNSDQLVRVLWTILQVPDERARELLQHLNPDLVAYPLAEELCLEEARGDHLTSGEDEDVPNADEGGFFGKLRAGLAEGPAALDLSNGELVQLLERIYELSRPVYRDVLDRARIMDIEADRERLECEATERAAEGESAVSDEDDDFEPLDEPAESSESLEPESAKEP